MAKYSITAILGVDSSAMSKGLKSAAGKLGSWAKSADAAIKRGVTTGLTAGGAAVTAFTAMSLREFGSFEKGMNEVFTLLPNMSEESLGAMSQDVLDLAKELGVLPEELVPALYDSLSAGVPPGNVMEFLEVSVKGAKAGVATTGEAVDALSSAVNAYGSDALSASKASDIMFTTIRLGKTTFPELSAALYNVTPAAAAAGVSFEDVGAAIAALTAQGVPTKVATTQIRQAILSMMAPNKAMSESFDALGMDASELGEILKEPGGLLKAMAMVEKAAGGNKTELKKMFGSVEALQAVMALTSGEGKKFADALGEIEDAAGATDQAFGTMDQGFERTLEKMKATLKATMIEFGKSLMPLFEKLVPLLSELVGFISDIPWPKLIAGLEELIKKAKPLFDELIAAVKAMPWEDLLEQGKIFFEVLATAIHQSVKLIIKVLPMVIPVIKAVMGWYQLMIARITVIATAIAEIADPIVKFVTKVADAISEFFNLISNPSPEQLDRFMKKVRELFQQLADSIVEIFDTIATFVTGKIKEVFENLGSGDGIKKFAKGVVDGFKNAFANLGEFITTFFTGVIDSIKGLFENLADGVSGGFKSRIVEVLEFALDQVKSIIGDLMTIFDTISEIVGEVIGDVIGDVEGAGDGLLEWFAGILDKAAALYLKVYSTYLVLAKNLISVIKDLVLSLKDDIIAYLKAAFNVAKAVFYGIKTVLGELLDLAFEIVDFVQNKFTKIIETIKPLLIGVAKAVLKYYTFVYNLIAAYIMTFVTIVKGAIKVIKAVVFPVLDAIIDIILKIVEVIINMSKAAIDAFTEAFGSAESQSMSLKDFFLNVFLPALENAMGKIEALAKMIGEGWQMLKPHVIAIFEWIEKFGIPIIKHMARTVAVVIKTLAPIIAGFFKAISRLIMAVWELVKPIAILIKELIEGIIESIGALWSILVGMILWDAERIEAGLSVLGEAAMDIAKAVWGVIKGIVKSIVNVIMAAWDLIWGVLKGAFELIKGIFTNLYKFIYDIMIGNSVTTIFKDTFEYALKVVERILGLIKEIFTGFFSMVEKGMEFIQGIVEAVFGAIGSVAGATFGVIKGGWKAMGKVADGVMGGLKKGWSAVTSRVKSGFSSMAEKGKSFWDKIKSGASDAWDSAKAGALGVAESTGLIEPEAERAREAIESTADAAEATVEAQERSAQAAAELAENIEIARQRQLLLNEAARQFILMGYDLTPAQQLDLAIEKQIELNRIAAEHPFIELANAPELTLKVGANLKPIVKKLTSIDRSLKSIDTTLKGKFVNQ